MLQLFDGLEPAAIRLDLRTSFALMAAMPLLIIPFERSKLDEHGTPKSDISDAARDPGFTASFQALISRPFETMLLDRREVALWRLSTLDDTDIDYPAGWRDALGCHPIADGAINDILSAKLGHVCRLIRNALAHANVVYLDEHGREDPHRRVTHLGFVSRARDSRKYRVLLVQEDAFVQFLRRFAGLINEIGLDTTFETRAAA
jgi:hypothetical protein